MVCFELMDSSCVDIVDETLNDTRMLDNSSEFEDLQIRQVAGGNITEFPPIFSQDGENILLVWKNTVRVFNVTTGEWVRDLEKTETDLVGIEFDPTNPKLLIGCTTNGEIVTWKWKSGVKHQKTTLNIPQLNFRVKSFNMFEGVEGNLEAVIVYLYDNNSKIKLDVFRMADGESLNGFPTKFNKLTPAFFKVSMSNRQKLFSLIQRQVIYIGNLSTGKRRFHHNPFNAFFSTVAIHPTSPVMATGDKDGRVILWSNTDAYEALTTIYHWHPAAVRCLAFTESGSHFFSGGSECVLVKWTVNRPEMRSFLARMRGAAINIAVGPKNQQIAVSLSDNGIQLLDANMGLKALIQNFSHVADDLTGEKAFPAGLRINPRNNCVVLNGRTGHLQFFSPHTRSFLYDIDITGENQLAQEPDQIIYNTRVVKVAICMDWMATAECWNDHEHFPQTRLKFWAFNSEKQQFSLHTDIQMPHEKGIAALEFSGIYAQEGILCASAGDRNLMTWSQAGNSWINAGRVSFRNLPIKSLAFSQDGSLLAAGFGNVCVLYTADELSIKGIFSAPSGLDGGVSKISIISPNTEETSKPPEGNKAIKLIQSYLDGSSEDLIKFIKTEALVSKVTSNRKKSNELNDDELFDQVMASKDLNLDQKIEVLKQLEIFCSVNGSDKDKLREFLDKSETLVPDLEGIVEKSASFLGENHKNSKNSYLWNVKMRRQSRKVNIFAGQGKNFQNGSTSETPESSPEIFPLTEVAEIQHISFSCGEFAHLLLVATRNRVLIWNLLTMKLKSVLRVSATSLTVDPVTGLFAIFTKHNNLFIFLPNTPIPLYHRRDLPNIHDAVWIPRRDPKVTSLSIDWQANSRLFFLSEKQELLHFVARNDEEDLTPGVAFLSEANAVDNYTPFGAMIAKQMQQKAQSMGAMGSAKLPAGILGKSNVNELINSTPHAMAPVSLLSKSFLKSLLITSKKRVESHEKSDKHSTAESSNMPISEMDAKTEERVEKMKIREMRNSAKEKVKPNEVSRDDKLSRIAKSCVQFEM